MGPSFAYRPDIGKQVIAFAQDFFQPFNLMAKSLGFGITAFCPVSVPFILVAILGPGNLIQSPALCCIRLGVYIQVPVLDFVDDPDHQAGRCVITVGGSGILQNLLGCKVGVGGRLVESLRNGGAVSGIGSLAGRRLGSLSIEQDSICIDGNRQLQDAFGSGFSLPRITIYVVRGIQCAGGKE